MALLVNACALDGYGIESARKSDFCAIARPIYISRADVLTDGTAREILNHNEKGELFCGWKTSEPVISEAPDASGAIPKHL